VGEARLLLDDVLEGRVAEERPADAAPRGGIGPLAAAGLVLFASAATAAAVWLLKRAPEALPTKFEIPVEALGDGPALALSPDGRSLVFEAAERLWIRRLDSLDAREIPGTDSGVMPFWSPDGSAVGYLASRKLWRVALAGGQGTAISDLPEDLARGGGASWAPDGRIVFASGNGSLWEIPARGGDPRLLLEADPGLEEDHFHDPHWLPDGRGLLFTIHGTGERGTDSIAVLAPDGSHEVVLRVEDQTVWRPVYSPTGHVLYARVGANDGIWALPFSLSSLAGTGEPFLVVPGARWPSVSRDGTLACTFGADSTVQQLVWVDREGQVQETVGQPQSDPIFIRLSPQGDRVAVNAHEEENWDIWVHDLRRGTRTRLTFDAAGEWNPSWSPSGDRIAYELDGTLMIRPADGTGEPVALGPGSNVSFSPDGKWLVYTDYPGEQTKTDIWVRPLAGQGEPRAFLATPAGEFSPAVSPDGRYLAYASPESGRAERSDRGGSTPRPTGRASSWLRTSRRRSAAASP
jgi:serine/threonine-protein kinase